VAVIVSILALLSLSAYGQQEANAKTLCTVFTIQDLSSGTENKDYQQPISASVTAAFEVGGYGIVAEEKWREQAQKLGLSDRALLGETQALSVAQALGAALAVTGYFTIEGDHIFIALQCWDVGAKVLAAALQQTARFNIAFYSLLHEKVTEMLPQIRLAQLGGETVIRVPTLSNPIFLSADEGMEVFLVDGTKIGTVSNGKVVWKTDGLVLGSAFSVEKRKSGYDSAQQTLRMASVMRLSPLVRAITKAVELDWTYGQLLGLGGALRLYTRPDHSFVFVGNYIYVQPPLNAAGNVVLHYDLNMGIGTYLFFPPDSMVRFGVSTGVGSIFSFPTAGSAGGAYDDLYLNVLNWWLETRALGPIIFLRQEWKFAAGIGDSALSTGLITVGNIPPVTLGVLFKW
jgi:hypothetical protein